MANGDPDLLARLLAQSQQPGLIGPIDFDPSAVSDTTQVLDASKLGAASLGPLVSGRDPSGKFAKVRRVTNPNTPGDLGRGVQAARARGAVQTATPMSKTFQTGRSIGRGIGRAGQAAGRMGLGTLATGGFLGVQLGEMLAGQGLGESFSNMRDAQGALGRSEANRVAAEQQLALDQAQFGGGQQPPQQEDPLTQALRGGDPSGGGQTQQQLGDIGMRDTPPGEFINPQGSQQGDRLAEFAGARVQGTTPQGTPEAEEITGLGRALSQFGKALETPGFQRFLSEMGIAFSGGFPNEPGTILGQANIQQLDRQAETQALQAVLSGEPLEDIDLGNLSSEALANISDIVLSREGLASGEGLEQQRIDLSEQGLEQDIEFQKTRLRQYDDQLGIQRDQLDINRFNAISQASGSNAPDNVQAFEHGYALDTVASSGPFFNAAMQAMNSRRDELGFGTIAEIQAALRGDDGQIDPQAIRSNLPEPLQQEFDRQVTELSRSVSRGFENANTTGQLDFTPGIVTAASREDALTMEDGALMQLPVGGIWTKQGDQFIPVDAVAQQVAQQLQQGAAE